MLWRVDERMGRDTYTRVLAIILARKGSKGVPGKNLLEVGGIPLITRTIRAAKECQYFERIIVSTDWPELMMVARKEGAFVIQRPIGLSGDEVSSEDCVVHVLDSITENYDIIVTIQNTNPFHDSEDMVKVIEMVSGGYVSAVTAVETHRFRWVRYNDDIIPKFTVRARRQDMVAELEEAGGVIGFRKAHFTHTHTFFGDPTGVVVIPWKRGVDIDTPEDLELARLLEKENDIHNS